MKRDKKRHKGQKSQPHDKSLLRQAQAASVPIFVMIAIIVLLTGYGDYMRKVEALSLFLPTSMFFDECMEAPGGLVTWLSTLLTQTMHLPWLGAIVFAMMLGAVQAAAIWAFKVKGPWRMCTVIIPVLILVAFTRLGYLIFTLRPQGYAFSLAVGALFSLLLAGATLRISKWWKKAIVTIIMIAVGYPFAGFYALLAGALVAAGSPFGTASGDGGLTGHKITDFIPGICAVAAICAVPPLWYRYAATRMMPGQMYVSGLPQFYAAETELGVLYASVFVVIAVFAIIPRLAIGSQKNQQRLALGVWVVAILAIWPLSYKDANFRTSLALDRALWDQDWQRAVEIAEEMPKDPTRLNTVLADIALMRTGQAGDRMFAMPYGWAPYDTPRSARPIHDAAGALISYHLGLINYAYRWGMEYSIAQCMSAERLKILAKCALLNYELPLAKTYLEILYNIPQHRAWAKKYLRYQAQPLEMLSDPEMAAIKPLMCHTNEFVNDQGAFESYIWPLLAQDGLGTPQYNELGMQAALVMRDLDTFMQRLAYYTPASGRVPRHYQEAALLWSLLGKHACPIPIDPAIEARHKAFLDTFRSTSNMEAEAQRDAMRDTFGDTYWFYFIFTENMNYV